MRSRSFLILLFAVLAFSMARAGAGECLIVSGGVSLFKWEKYKAAPHDLWWMNFIRAARIRIQQIREQNGPDIPITWFVYSSAYKSRGREDGRNFFPDIISVRDRYNVNLKFFENTSQLIDYINHGQPRETVKIVSFDYFGHSNKACFLFDYSNIIDSSSKVWLHEDELTKIRRGAFAKNAYVKSWGCHTGESMSKKFARATGVRMIGAVGKTQYMTETLPVLSTAAGRWTY